MLEWSTYHQEPVSITRTPAFIIFARIVSLINQQRGLFQTLFVSFSPRNRKAAFAFALQRNDCAKEFTLSQNALKHKPFPTAAADAGTRTKAAILVFFGGACYGFNATCYKLSYAWGFSSAQIAAAQMWAGFALFAVFLFFNRARGEKWAKLGCANILKLLGVGAATCITSIFYTYAMSVLPVALALTLLFQFTWIGTVIQVIMTRRPPAFSQVISAAIIVFGTVFASGLYATDLSSCNPWGIAAGLLAAVSCASFLALSGQVQPKCSQAQRGLIICGGAVIVSHFICPDFIVSGVLLQGIAPLGLIAGACGFFLPILLLSMGAPHLPAGLTSLLAASELPAGLFVAMIVLGSPIGAVEWLGVAIILFGICVSQLRLFPRKTPR